MEMSAYRRGGVLDLRDAAYLLKVRPTDVLRTLEHDDVPARRIAGEWRFEREALRQWLAAGSSSRYATPLFYRLSGFSVASRGDVACWQV